MNLFDRQTWSLAALAAVSLAVSAATSGACTVFVMTDGQQTLFGNNEDYSNPNTRIWFIPATEGRFGCVFEGFDDGWGQGGCNTEGLAFGWVAGFKAEWQRPAGLKTVRGNSCQRMLETCTTVEEAVAFYQTHWEESFSYGRLLVADRTGKSAVIRAEDGKLAAPIATHSQGIGHRFGLRGEEATAMLAKVSKASLTSASKILKATVQEGPNATKYSVVYDLRSGAIHLYFFANGSEATTLDLAGELSRGPHYYDLPSIREQLSEELRSLTESMKSN